MNGQVPLSRSVLYNRSLTGRCVVVTRLRAMRVAPWLVRRAVDSAGGCSAV
jgi:hypothetical protein